VELSGRARRIARSILAYLAEHPDAKDSIDGIRLWWVDEPDQCNEMDIQRAIRELSVRGLITSLETAPGSVVFAASKKFMRAPDLALHEFDPNAGDYKQ
jgi:hypothetical protein